MNPFSYERPEAVEPALGLLAGATRDGGTAAGEALRHARAAGLPRILAGGTNLVDLMKVGLMQPATLVDIRRLPLRQIAATADGGLRLGALARNAETADHALVRERYPVLRAAILAGASPQIRNMATNGGNLLQRTRCYYFYDPGVPCNKHEPGSGCPAREGLARQHAILGASEHCIATHPSDMCVALAALEASVHVVSERRGERVIPFTDFHRLPDVQPERDTTLEPDELITHLTLPSAERFQAHACYLKVRERASYAFALVSVAALLDLAPSPTSPGATSRRRRCWWISGPARRRSRPRRRWCCATRPGRADPAYPRACPATPSRFPLPGAPSSGPSRWPSPAN
jgi:xanthine dehydrogenase YagS FAD-binding subunit